MSRSLAVIAVLLLCSHAGVAQAANVERGRAYARSHCARCHSIDRNTASSFELAPPFRTLHERYPVESLEEALAEGIVTGHPAMPEFRLEPDQISDFIAFLKSLEK
jgi:cytochrome c